MAVYKVVLQSVINYYIYDYLIENTLCDFIEPFCYTISY